MITSFQLFESKDDKQRAFTVACGIGDTNTVKSLIKDVDPTEDNQWGLLLAANNGHLDVIKELLKDSRFDPSVDKNHAIIRAARGGYLEIVKALLEDPRVDPSDRDNLSIRYAARYGHLEIVKILLEDPRVDPSSTDNWAIQSAETFGHDDIVYVLLNQPKVYNSLPKGEVKKIAKGRPLVRDMIKKMNESNDKEKEFIMASMKGDFDTVKRLLDIEKVDPTADNNEAIIRAASNGHVDIFKLLLKDSRVDPSDIDNYAIELAAENGHLEIIKLLLKDPRINPSLNDNYAIRIASRFGHDDVVYILLNDPRVYSKLSKKKIKNYAKGRPLVRDMIKKMNESIKIDGYNFNMGDCDIFAISLHRLHGYPLCAVRGKFLESEWGGEREWDYEYCHIVVKLPNGNYMDSNGEQTKEELIADCYFSEDVKKVDIVDIKENDAMGLFSCTDQEEDIKHVMKHLKKIGEINGSIYETLIDTKGKKINKSTYRENKRDKKVMKLDEFHSSPMAFPKDLGYDIKTSLGHSQQGSEYLTKDNKDDKFIDKEKLFDHINNEVKNIIDKVKEIEEKNPYINCESFCNMLVGGNGFKSEFNVVNDKTFRIGSVFPINKINELEDVLKVGDIIAFGEPTLPRHYVVYIGDGYVYEVEEWGSKPQKKSLKDNINYYEGIAKIYRSK